MKIAKLHVGNLNYSVTDTILRETFASSGRVQSAKLAIDEKGRTKGFAFVEMSSVQEAEKAMNELNGTELEGLSMKISEARTNTNGREFGKYGKGRRGGGNFKKR